MQIIVKEIFNHPYLTSGKDRITSQVISGADFKECFEKIYKLERSNRYNNYVRCDIVGEDIKQLYQEWKKDGVSIDLYYGNATVD